MNKVQASDFSAEPWNIAITLEKRKIFIPRISVKLIKKKHPRLINSKIQFLNNIRNNALQVIPPWYRSF